MLTKIDGLSRFLPKTGIPRREEGDHCKSIEFLTEAKVEVKVDISNPSFSVIHNLEHFLISVCLKNKEHTSTHDVFQRGDIAPASHQIYHAFCPFGNYEHAHCAMAFGHLSKSLHLWAFQYIFNILISGLINGFGPFSHHGRRKYPSLKLRPFGDWFPDWEQEP